MKQSVTKLISISKSQVYTINITYEFNQIKYYLCAKSGTELLGVYFPSWLPNPTALIVVFVFPNFCTIHGCCGIDYKKCLSVLTSIRDRILPNTFLKNLIFEMNINQYNLPSTMVL